MSVSDCQSKCVQTNRSFRGAVQCVSPVLAVIGNGCKLPSAEPEDYLPFECPLERLVDSNALSAAGVTVHPHVALHHAWSAYGGVGSSSGIEEAISLHTSHDEKSFLAQLVGAASQRHLLALRWSPTRRFITRSRHSNSIEALLSGPKDGWCSPCSGKCSQVGTTCRASG